MSSRASFLARAVVLPFCVLLSVHACSDDPVDNSDDLAAACVDRCRDLFATCTQFTGVSGVSSTPSSCADDCADTDFYTVCRPELEQYEECEIRSNSDCVADESECGIEWGVYTGCQSP